MAIEKYLQSLQTSGYGEYSEPQSDLLLGASVYRLPLNESDIELFENGFRVDDRMVQVKVVISGVLKITSHLSAKVFSEASENQRVDTLIPMEIHTQNAMLVLNVPLLIYSRLLIILNEMWRRPRG
ncbi:TPA: hypothetical protein SMQ04_000504 [Pseudomonas putida]|nr:hypothetical protein [Pseudomonas putida]